MQDTEEPEAVSVVELSRVERFRNCFRRSTVRRVLVGSLVFTFTLNVFLLVKASLYLFDSSEDHSSKKYAIGYISFTIVIVLLFLVSATVLYGFGVISKCLNERRIQNPIVKEVKNIKYKNIEQYQGNITEFCNKPSVIKLEELGSEELKDPIVYNKQLYSFKEFKKAIKTSDGIVPHDKLIIDPKDIRRLKIDNKDILEDLV